MGEKPWLEREDEQAGKDSLKRTEEEKMVSHRVHPKQLVCHKAGIYCTIFRQPITILLLFGS